MTVGMNGLLHDDRVIATHAVLVIDRGNYAIVRPVPDDPVVALQGERAADEVAALLCRSQICPRWRVRSRSPAAA